MIINYDILETISDEFILEKISSRVILMNQDSEKCERYTANLNISNNENDLHYMLETSKIENIDFLNGCIYTDINEAR